MSFSKLYSSICRGAWFIASKEVDANMTLISRLLEHGELMKDDSKMSDRVAMEHKAYCGYSIDSEAKAMQDGDSYESVPEGSTAVIQMQGTMLKYGNWCSYGTTEIAEMVREAADSKNIDSIILEIDSGGGAVDAIAPMVDAIKYAQSKRKCVVALCDLCASAAYYVAVHCNEIIAANTISAEFGSIGVMMSFMDYAKYYEKEGMKQHTIYSNLSEYKNAPFELAKNGEYDLIRSEELDPLARDFQNAVKNRRCNLDEKTKGILSGKMFYAVEAVKVGLADCVGTMEYAAQRCKEINTSMMIDEYMNLKK